MSVHSGAHISFPGMPIGAYDPDYPDNASSNFTTHPYSTYGGQPSNNMNQQYQQNNNAAQYGQLQNPNNNAGRAHIFINRQINKFMMNPIYKSKQTLNSLQMHRYAGIPWRGN